MNTNAKTFFNKIKPAVSTTLETTDPEFFNLFSDFAYDEVMNQGSLDDKTKLIAILATCLGCQGLDEFKVKVPAALNVGVTPVQVKEIVYQATAYLGIARVYPFLKAVNEVFTTRGIELPLELQGTTTPENRREKGTEAQVKIFGEGMKEFYKSGPQEKVHINRWLAANCFGDYYTRGGLDLATREMITFCFLSAQGGCESQLTSHATANMRMGNSREFLIEVVSQCVPYIGYPRSLNALNCIETAAKQINQ